MNTPDLAIVSMATVTLVNVVLDHRWRMKTADRTRIVSPPKAPAQPATGTAATVEDLDRRRSA